MERDDSNTVRLANLAEDVKESDVRELISSFGPVTRVFLPRNLDTNTCKGYSFINFVDKSSAQKCINALNGFGYANLILSCDWANQK
jgi:translation initiation factor 3 subunit G